MPVPDREGVLAEITTLAGDLGINIYDIEIAHSAEGPRGVLTLVVDGTESARLREAVAAAATAARSGRSREAGGDPPGRATPGEGR